MGHFNTKWILGELYLYFIWSSLERIHPAPVDLIHWQMCRTYIISDLYQCRWATPLQTKQARYQQSSDRCLLGTTQTRNTSTVHFRPYEKVLLALKWIYALVFVSLDMRSPCGVRSWKEARWDSWLSPVCRTWTPRRSSPPDLSLASRLKGDTRTQLYTRHTFSAALLGLKYTFC